MQRKKGISLIVLVITIIVMVVLVGTIIISLNNNGIMTKANNSVKKSNLKEVQTMADTYWGEAYSSGITTQSALDTYVREKLIETLGQTEYGNYTVTVTERGTTVDILTGIVLSDTSLELEPEDTETLTATLKNISGTVSWTTSDENVVSIAGTGNTITITAESSGTATITVTCGIYNETCTVTVQVPPITVSKGDYVEYDVAYTDARVSANEFTVLNGWRIFSVTENEDGTYSNIKLISTGIPAYLNYYESPANDSWWVTDSSNLTNFKNMLKETGGDGQYTFYTGYSTYYALRASAGMYYNFEDIKFMYSENGNSRGDNLGSFIKIISNGTEYSSTINDNAEKTGGELFNLLGSDAIVRLVTLPEVNLAVGRTDIDSYEMITSEEDILGLLKLENISNVPNMIGFTKYKLYYYWYASPSPRNSYRAVTGMGSTDMSGSSGGNGGIRPLIVLNPGVKVKFVDTNNNGVPEIQIVN